RVRRHMAAEKQLTVDPSFFHALRLHLPRITAVETKLLRGRNTNELTRFRYDVILHVGGEAVEEGVSWRDWRQERMTLPDLRGLLLTGTGELAFTGIPNGRVAADAAALRLMADDKPPATVADLRAAIEIEAGGV